MDGRAGDIEQERRTIGVRLLVVGACLALDVRGLGRRLGDGFVAAGLHRFEVGHPEGDAVRVVLVELVVERLDLGAGLGELGGLFRGQVGATFGGGGGEDGVDFGLGRCALIDLGLQLGAQDGEEIGHLLSPRESSGCFG